MLSWGLGMLSILTVSTQRPVMRNRFVLWFNQYASAVLFFYYVFSTLLQHSVKSKSQVHQISGFDNKHWSLLLVREYWTVTGINVEMLLSRCNQNKSSICCRSTSNEILNKMVRIKNLQKARHKKHTVHGWFLSQILSYKMDQMDQACPWTLGTLPCFTLSLLSCRLAGLLLNTESLWEM